jgi:hypothetical protein
MAKRIETFFNIERDQRSILRFRIGLRSDVYFLVRTSDESTDKIEANVVWLSWSNHVREEGTGATGQYITYYSL